jgi:hypothetical protein
MPKSARPKSARVWWGAALLVLSGCHSGPLVIADIEAGGAPPAMPCSRRVLFVVGTSPLSPGDTALRDRFESLGFAVTVVDAAMVTVADANGVDLCFVSRTIRASLFAADFRQLPVPMMVPEYGLYPALGMTGPTAGTDWGAETVTTTELQIVDPAHPLAAGFTDTVTVLTPGAGLYGFGVPGAGAVKVAAASGGSAARFAIFGYEQGAKMDQLTAPARRVGWFVDKEASTRLTANGWALFDAAVRWAATTCAP